MPWAHGDVVHVHIYIYICGCTSGPDAHEFSQLRPTGLCVAPVHMPVHGANFCVAGAATNLPEEAARKQVQREREGTLDMDIFRFMIIIYAHYNIAYGCSMRPAQVPSTRSSNRGSKQSTSLPSKTSPSKSREKEQAPLIEWS